MITFLFDSNVVEYLLSVFCVCELILNAAVSARSSLKKTFPGLKKKREKKRIITLNTDLILYFSVKIIGSKINNNVES